MDALRTAMTMLGTAGLAAAPALARADEGGVIAVASGAAVVGLSDTAAAEIAEPAPVITFGRAVDLAGRDIEPRPRMSIVAGASGVPSGLPLARARMTSRYGMRTHPIYGGARFHSGIDLAASHGTPVSATSAGVVRSAGWAGGYGVMVVLRHADGIETRYAHLSATAVRAGQSVTNGQIVGYVGSTGRSTGPHLHYETRKDGRAMDPTARH